MAREETYTYADKYCFFAEWYNELAEVVKHFLLSFYPHDETLELYDMKYNRMFLRRTHVEKISLDSLYKGAIVTIFSRQICIVGYANKWTEKVFEEALQKIFTVIKPDAICHVGFILNYLEKNGFKLTKIKMGRLTQHGVESFMKSCPLLGSSIHEFSKSMTEKSSLGIEALGERGFSSWLKAVGPEDPAVAKSEAPDSIRAKLGIDLMRNAIHVNSKLDGQIAESQIWFGRNPPLLAPSCCLSNSTCCVIKPHALHDRLAGEILSFITESGFQIVAMEMFYLDRRSAAEFYEVYKGVIPEFSSMVTHLSSGPCIALEVVHTNEPDSTSEIFRQLAGPTDPVVARKVQPNSIRAKYGSTTVDNAVHCTDLPDDTKLEVEFFFKLKQT